MTPLDVLWFILDNQRVIFSYQGQYPPLNYIFVVAKQYMYKNRFFNSIVNLRTFINILGYKFECEKYIVYINNSISESLAKWGPFTIHSQNFKQICSSLFIF